MLHEQLTEQIIRCAFAIYNKMGFGYLESVYERCMAIELQKAGLKAVFQQEIPVFYDGQSVGVFVADLLVEDCVLVELKSVRLLADIHEVQLVHYLKSTGIEIGLLINFGPSKVDIRRKIRTLPASLPSSPSDPVDPVYPVHKPSSHHDS